MWSRVVPYAQQLGFAAYFLQVLADLQNGVQARSAKRTISSHPTLIRMRGNVVYDQLEILQFIPFLNKWMLVEAVPGYRFISTFCTILIDSDLYILGGSDRDNRQELDLVIYPNIPQYFLPMNY